MTRNPLSKKAVSLAPSGIRKFFDIVSEMEDAISLGVGEPDFDTPWRVREEGIYSLERGRTFYTSNAGLKELKLEISRYLARTIQVDYDYSRPSTWPSGPCWTPGTRCSSLSPAMYPICPAPCWQTESL